MRLSTRHYLTLAICLGGAAAAPAAMAQSGGGAHRVIDIEILGTRKENEIKLSEKNKAIDVTVLGSVNFRVEDIDKATIEVEGATPTSLNGRKVDYNNDRNADVEYRVTVGKMKIDESTTTICLTGALLDGTRFRGCGPVSVTP